MSRVSLTYSLKDLFLVEISLFILALPGAGVLAQTQLVDVGGYRLEYFVRGTDGPTIVFLNGGTAPMDYWNPVVGDLSESATVLTYERAGHSGSEMGREPRHALNVAEELRALLLSLGLPEPHFLVAHSAGCLYARVYASRFPNAIGGILLIEPGDKPFLDSFGTHHLSDVESRNWADLWEHTWSRLAQGDGAYGREVAAKEQTIRQLQQSAHPPDVPLIVVSAVDQSRPDWFLSDLSQESVAEFYRQKVVFHKILAQASEQGQQVTVHGATHVVHEDRPDLVLSLILELIGQRIPL